MIHASCEAALPRPGTAAASLHSLQFARTSRGGEGLNFVTVLLVNTELAEIMEVARDPQTA